MTKLEVLRTEIDRIDDELVSLMQKRMEVSLKVAQYKNDNNLAVFDKDREEEIQRKIVSKVLKSEFRCLMPEIVGSIMQASRILQERFIENKKQEALASTQEGACHESWVSRDLRVI